ncbi:hypothetical protein GYB22_00525 [bacterium]|nr:hypothetical protein [bacterium]
MALKEENKSKKSKVYLFVIVLALFLINLLMLYKLISNDRELEQTQTELVSTQEELAEIEQLKLDLEDELEIYKGQNEKMDSVISVRDAEIQAKVAEIKRLLQKDGVTKAELNRARSEIASLRSEVQALTMEIDSLSKENQYLKDENYIQLKQLEAKDKKIQQIDSVNTDLSKQVKVGERIFLKSLTATPLRSALIGDYKATDKLSRLERIEISFTLANNDLATKGEKVLYFKIQTPNKSTLVDPAAGSGNFNYQGGESTYTLKKSVDFQNTNESGTVSFDKVEGMTPGEYSVTVYSETHEMGNIKFELR